jgi:hypothetical protein
MKCYAARYIWQPAEQDHVVLYKHKREPTEAPHDYFLDFTKYEWRKMGGRMPKKEEVIRIELTVKEVVR